MAKYAINAEAIEMLNNLSQQLRISIEGILTSNKNIKIQIMSLMDDLGIYGMEIFELLLHMNDVCESCTDDINFLSEKIKQKASEIQELLTFTGDISSLAMTSNNKVWTVEDIASWIGTVNPHYNDSNYMPWDNPYHVNCGSCALSVEKRLNGDNSAVASITNIGTDAGMEQATGKKCVYMPIDEIEAKLKSQGPGAHMIVGINRKRTFFGMPQSGHWFNAYYDGQKIYTVDGQCGQILEWPYDYGDIAEYCAMI